MPRTFGFGGSPPRRPADQAPSRSWLGPDEEGGQAHHSGELAELVERILRRLPYAVTHGSMMDIDDLRQEAMIAVHAAAASFDPSRGTVFPAYARTCVMNAIAGALRGVDPLPEGVRRDLRTILVAEDDLLGRLSRVPTDAEVAAQTGLSVERIALTRWWQQRGRFVDPEPGQDIWGELADRSAPTPEEQLVVGEERSQVRAGLDRLPERARRIVLARVVDAEPVQVVAAREGISAARVSQVTAQALALLEEAVRG